MAKMMRTKGGWSARWKYGVKGTNLSPTKEQESTWFLWGYSPRGGQAIIATVRKTGTMNYDVRDSMRGGKLVASYGGKTALSRAKRHAERLAGIK